MTFFCLFAMDSTSHPELSPEQILASKQIVAFSGILLEPASCRSCLVCRVFGHKLVVLCCVSCECVCVFNLVCNMSVVISEVVHYTVST